MNIFNKSEISTLPTTIVYQPACLTSLPMSAETSDIWSNGGSGIGTGSDAVRSAIGEYFERRHFYMEVVPDAIGTLDVSLTATEQESFMKAFHQTRDESNSPKNINDHHFNLSEVYRACDWTSCMAPTACISLSAHQIADDNSIYPLRDTCGCSFHWDAKLAVFGSMKEQLERQFLAKFWLTKMCQEIISEDQIFKELYTSRSRHLFKHLKASGNVTVIDISDPLFPGVCILTVYGSSNSRHVNYCAGMAYSENLKKALEKSIHELWQTFRFIDLFHATDGDESEIEDSYLRHFLNCNSFETYLEISSVVCCAVRAPTHPSKFNADALLTILKALGIAGFVYLKPITINGVDHFASKFFSPDLFLHMDNSRNINLRNKYSESFYDLICESRKQSMVPFP